MPHQMREVQPQARVRKVMMLVGAPPQHVYPQTPQQWLGEAGMTVCMVAFLEVAVVAV